MNRGKEGERKIFSSFFLTKSVKDKIGYDRLADKISLEKTSSKNTWKGNNYFDKNLKVPSISQAK